MKKIRLNVADLGATEILSREQLKSVFGGSGSGSGSGSGTDRYVWDCLCSNSTGAIASGNWTLEGATSLEAAATIPEHCPSPLTGQCTIHTY